jgi:hypothetical protein
MGRDLIFLRNLLSSNVITVANIHHLSVTAVSGKKIVSEALKLWYSIFAVRKNNLLFCNLVALHDLHIDAILDDYEYPE